MLKSKRLNKIVNQFNFLTKFFVFFVVLYTALNLIMVPFGYFRILYSIMTGKYRNKQLKQVAVKMSVKIRHFLCFLVFGPVFLLYKVLVEENIALITKSRSKIKEKPEYLFDYTLYRLLKRTIIHFKYIKKVNEVSIEEFTKQFKLYFHQLDSYNQH